MSKLENPAQQVLFSVPPSKRDSTCNGNGSTFCDPSFAVNKNAPVHRWVPWIAGFSRTFVAEALKRHLSHTSTVLDPFAGVGTTLVEAVLTGHNAIGFEINPYAALATRTKLEAHRLAPDVLRRAIANFEKYYSIAIKGRGTTQSVPPPGFKTRSEFYSPKVLQKVLILKDFMSSQAEGTLRDIFRLAFASTMVSYSNYSYEPSLSRRSSAGKAPILDFPVGRVVISKLHQIAEDIEWMSARTQVRAVQAHVYNESFFRYNERIASGTVDLVITSPPYLNNYHYNRNTRPQLYWLAYVERPSDFKQLENENFGKYWQTVRQKEHVDLDFPLDDQDILDCLRVIRAQKPERGVYGGAGWANYAASYFNDCHRFAKTLKRVLRRRATALVVIGNNILQGVMIPTDQYLARIAEHVGLEVVDIHVPRSTRVGNSIIQSNVRVVKAKCSHQLYEAIVELRKR